MDWSRYSIPATRLEVFTKGFFEPLFKDFFLVMGFAARLDGDFDERPDLAGADFFFAGFFIPVFAFGRFGARDLAVGCFRAGFERGFALRLAFALDLGRDFFTGFKAFLAMVVLLLGCGSQGRAHRYFRILPRLGRLGKTSNYNMCLTGIGQRPR